MPIGGVVNGATGTLIASDWTDKANGTNNPGTNPAEETQEETNPVEETKPVEETSETETGTDAGAGVAKDPVASSSGSSGTTAVAANDSEVISNVLTQIEPEERDDKVIAVDFARRAAIAAQSKEKTENLLAGFDEDAFSPVSLMTPDAEGAYAKSDVTVRYGGLDDVNA